MRIPPLVAALACLLLAPIARAPQSLAQSSPIEIAYEEPTDPSLRSVYERLKQWGTLEKLQAFLEPLRLPRKLTVRTAQCGTTDMPYRPSSPVTVCYELMDQMQAGSQPPRQGVPANSNSRSVHTGCVHEMRRQCLMSCRSRLAARKTLPTTRCVSYRSIREDVPIKRCVHAQLFGVRSKMTGATSRVQPRPIISVSSTLLASQCQDYLNFGGWWRRD